MSIPERVSGALERPGSGGKGFLVAVSGGVDSVCLLRLLVEVTGGGGRLEVAHLDHGVRAGSAADATFCASLARELNLPFHSARLAPGALKGGDGFQAKARAHRRRFLEAVAAARSLGVVVLGHHRDDQVETVLFRLLRGAGPRGISGMEVWAPPYLRPLLGVGRHELEALAASRGWAWREDPSNQTGAYARNRLRRELLPLLEAVHPGAREAILRYACLAAEDDRVLSELACRQLAELGTTEPEGVRFSAAALGELPPALRRRVFLAAWAGVGCDPGALSAAHLDTVAALLGPGRAHRRAAVPGPGVFARSYGELWVLAPGAGEPPPVAVALSAPGRAGLGPAGLVVSWGREPPPGVPAVGVPVGRGVGGLLLRTWEAGDRLVGLSRRPVKVKDLLMDARVPPWRRRRALLVADAQGPLGLLAPGRAWSLAAGPSGWVWGGLEAAVEGPTAEIELLPPEAL